jgi:hypothetical protein
MRNITKEFTALLALSRGRTMSDDDTGMYYKPHSWILEDVTAKLFHQIMSAIIRDSRFRQYNKALECDVMQTGWQFMKTTL